MDGSWLWLVIDVFAVVALAAAMLFGSHMWRSRSRSPELKRASDEAVWRLYHPAKTKRDREILP